MSPTQSSTHPACATCDLPAFDRICMNKNGKGSPACPTLGQDETLTETGKEYDDPQTLEFARQASIQEAECYANRHQRPYVLQPSKTRIVETCEFADKMGYHRLGLAFCAGLIKEARLVAGILEDRKFDVVSVLCKAGRTPKTRIGITDEEKIFQGTDESMCNPIFQAKVLNHEQTEFNILLGLCVGHDSLFFKHAEAPTTVLAVKDRVTGHNPLAAVYLSESYYRRIRYPSL